MVLPFARTCAGCFVSASRVADISRVHVVVLLTLMLGIEANASCSGGLNSGPAAIRSRLSEPSASLYQIRHHLMSEGLLTTRIPAFEDFRRRNTTFRRAGRG